ncbi:MAG: type III pantothenate kinase [Balneolaceae bacterium]
MNATDDALYYVDAGHTRIKTVVRAHAGWEVVAVHTAAEPETFFLWLESMFETEPNRRVVICSVLPTLQKRDIPEVFSDKVHLISVWEIPRERIGYQTPQSLGLDRYLSCLGAVGLGRGPAVVVDAGTACTVDWMEETGLFRGGVILPGLTMAFESLESIFPGVVRGFRQLPDVFPGQSTTDSLLWGTGGAWTGSLDYFLRRYETSMGSFRLYLTGGDAGWLSTHLPEPWSERGRVRPWLMFDGMKRHLEESGFSPVSGSGPRR